MAEGHAGDAPGAKFTINMAEHLPPAAPAIPVTYIVRVTPGTKPKMQIGSSVGPKKKMLPGKPVGPPSNDVVITYASTTTPPLHFNIMEIYTALTFELGDIQMIVDQTGAGVEEFWVMGFVTEHLAKGSLQSGKQEVFGPLYAAIDPDGPRSKGLAGGVTFPLNGPFSPEWPRLYTVVISVMEEDGGDLLNKWEAELSKGAATLLEGPVGELISDWLAEHFDEYLGDIAIHAAHAGADLAVLLVTISDSIAGPIIGAVIAAMAIVAAGIITDYADDYYGTEFYSFVLPTNILDEVHKRPGSISSTSFYFPPEVMTFKGTPVFGSAVAWDGAVSVDSNFQLWAKEMFSG